MASHIPLCWPCDHFRTTTAGYHCAQGRPQFPERCPAYQYEPGADMEVALEQYADEEQI